jgi:uncharacterized membrane protein
VDPLLVKYAHIVGATLLFGTGLGTAFHFWMAHLTGEPRTIAAAGRSTILADWLFTAPAVVLQPITGALLMREVGWTLGDFWIATSFGLYVFTGACWIPVVWLQMRMTRLARAAAAAGTPLPDSYRRFARLWFCLGWPAFGAVLAIFFLMIFKPGGFS